MSGHGHVHVSREVAMEQARDAIAAINQMLDATVGALTRAEIKDPLEVQVSVLAQAIFELSHADLAILGAVAMLRLAGRDTDVGPRP